jgi:hypothetical protein
LEVAFRSRPSTFDARRFLGPSEPARARGKEPSAKSFAFAFVFWPLGRIAGFTRNTIIFSTARALVALRLDKRGNGFLLPRTGRS